MPVDVDAVVLFNRRLSEDYNVVAVAAPEIALQAKPGQFVMIKRTGGAPLLRRPFSVFELVGDEVGQVTGFSLLNKRVGVTTRMLFGLRPGDRLRCLGPMGRPFSMAEPPQRAWMIAGGVGLAPFASLAAALRERRIETTLFYGGRSTGDLFHLDTFEQLGVSLQLTTDDGTRGEHGKVTVPLERALRETAATQSVRLYACGPTPMMRAVTELAASHGRPTEVSLEQVMGCGLGGCYSCVVPVRYDGGQTHFVRSCLDGPVFDGGAVVWDALG